MAGGEETAQDGGQKAGHCHDAGLSLHPAEQLHEQAVLYLKQGTVLNFLLTRQKPESKLVNTTMSVGGL